ncbi:MAG: TIGR01212 family radical SAM protein [Oligoflexia bacterium]|nr:TIGR01212 family radical SAM protein [Oligoflexia bacterium]
MDEIFYSYGRYLRETFGGKTYKVVVSSRLTCPTRDGAIAKDGCAFCDLRGSSSYFGKQGRGDAIREQLDRRLPEIQRRFKATRFLAYFQSYTNTYADVGYLRQIYEEALSHPLISGLCIGTRPDCLPEECLELLEELAEKTHVSLELGVQSFENPTLEWLTRGHDGECSIRALERLSRRSPHVHVCAHLIFGSPTDSATVARDAALLLNEARVKGAKLHQLMVLEHTELAERYRTRPFSTPSLEEYSERVLEFLEHLSPTIYLERLHANASHPDECLAPAWSREHWEPHNRIREILLSRGCRQGSRLPQP